MRIAKTVYSYSHFSYILKYRILNPLCSALTKKSQSNTIMYAIYL